LSVTQGKETAATLPSEAWKEKEYGANNTIVTKDAAEAARALLRSKIGTLNAGIDPEIIQAGLTLATYHIEAGARSFTAYAKAMISDLGDKVAPYLREWYEAVRAQHEFDGMTAVDEIDKGSDPARVELPAGRFVKNQSLTIKKKGRKWFEASPDGKSYVVKVEINQTSDAWETGQRYTFPAMVDVQSSKYGSTTTIYPLDKAQADAADAIAVEPEILRWLGYVEEKAPGGYIYQNGVDKLRELGISRFPALNERLSAALAEARKGKGEAVAAKEQAKAEAASQPKTYLSVPFEEKDEAKRHGARWDSVRRQWYVTDGVPAALEKYVPGYVKKLPEGQFIISEGEGYGGRPYRVGETMRNPRKEGPEYVTVVSSDKNFFKYEGMSFGVGDDSGYIYSAVVRPATEEEAAPIMAKEGAARDKAAAKKEVDALASKFRNEGERPEGDNIVSGERLLDTQTIYGGGNWWVIQPDEIWYVQNNGADGDNWSSNNVRTGGAGAIGWRMPFDQSTADKLRQLDNAIKTRETDKGVALESRSDRLSFARQVLTDLAAEDEMFRYPVSKSKSIDGVMADVFPDALYWGESTQPDERSESGADHRFTFQLPKYRDDKGRMVPGKPFYVYTTDDGRVWINVLNLSPGARGSNIYAAVANYAYNTGKKFVGDPLGVSEDAVVARTKMMLSSTLRFGTTRHLDASPEQIKGNTEEGIEPLDWSGDDIDRVESLIHTFITTLQNRLPELKNYHYDFAKQGFFDNDGKRIAEPVQDVGNKAMESGDVEGRSGGGIRSARAGKASLRLGILIQSLVSEEGRAIGDGGILEAVLNQSGSLVNNGQLDGLMSKAPERGLSVSSAKIESVRDRFMQEFKGAEALDIRVVNSRDDIPARFRPSPYAVGVYHDDVGLVYLIASKIESPERAAQILMHEAVGHYGLMNMMGDKFQPILGDVLRVARAKGELTSRPEVGDANYATVEAVRMDYPEVSDDVIAQEVLARMAEIGGKQSVFKIAVMRIRQWLRGVAKALGIDYDFTEQDARDLVALAGEHLRNGKNLAAETEGEGVAYASRAGLESRSAVTGASGRDYTPEQLSAFKRTGRTVEVPTLKERVAALTDNWSMKLRQGIADQFAPLAQLDKHAYVQARMSKAYDGALEALMLYGKVRVDGGIYNADMSGGVLDRLLRPLGNEVDDFMWWTAAKRAERLSAEDREHLFTQADIDAMKALATGKTSFDYTLSNGTVTRSREMIYRDAAKVMDEFNKSILDIAEQSGLIDGASRSIWENEFYIPFYRALEDEKVGGPGVKSGLVRQYAFKQLKGGSGELNHDLIANVLQNWAHLLAASAKNRAAASALQAAKRTGVADEVPAGTKGAVYYLDKGEQKHFVVNDPFLMDAISAIEFGGFKGPVMKVMGKFKHYLTLGVTANPAFKIRNLIRDSIAAIGQSDLDTNPLKNLKQGFKATDKSKQTYVSMLASGGIVKFGSMLEGNRADHVRQLIEEGVSEDTILDSESKIKAFWRRRIKPAIEAYNDLGDRGESINRAALYEQMIAKGMSHEEASYAARDLLDFSMGGAWQGVRLLTQVVPFMNARIQGLYKLGRADKKRLGYVVGAVSLASLALLAAYGDDDDWKKREDWDRESYWWFKFGGVAFRIPKPFEIGAIGTLAERSAELFFDNEMTGKRYMDRLGALVGSQLAMNPVPQLFKPIVDIYANKDSFSGRPIETMGMEKLRTEDRYTARTSEIAKILGKAGMMSPVQIDQAIRGYFGWLGTATTGAIDYMARVADDTPRPEMKLRDVFLAGNFVETLPTNSSRYVSQMYDQAKEIEEAWNSLQHYRKLGETEKAQQILEENRDELGRYHAVERVKRDESEINRKIQQIEQSKGLSPETKRKLLDQLSQQRDRVARRLAAA
jgi:hypothetical protein